MAAVHTDGRVSSNRAELAQLRCSCIVTGVARDATTHPRMPRTRRNSAVPQARSSRHRATSTACGLGRHDRSRASRAVWMVSARAGHGRTATAPPRRTAVQHGQPAHTIGRGPHSGGFRGTAA